MGGRGASSGGSGGGAGGAGAGIGIGGAGGGLAGMQNVANQAPSPQNTPVVPNASTVLSQMTDDQLATLYQQSRTVDMPNHLKDVADATQRFVYMAGVNAKPQVLDQASFNQYLRDNNIPRNQVLSRSTNGANYTVNGTTIRLTPNQVTDLTKYGDLNYIGGKHGGQVYGAGTYFDMNGGRNTGYAGGATMIGVLNPNTAKPISRSQLRQQTAQWVQSHPKFARQVGSFDYGNMSIYALAQGYNVITGGTYHNVIDRSALVMQSNNI